MRLVYGVFSSREPAQRALSELNNLSTRAELDEYISTASIHEYQIRNVDLPPSGNFAERSAILGGAGVGAMVGLVLGLLFSGPLVPLGGPETILGSDLGHLMLLILATAIFGGILSGIAGAAGTRARVAKLRRQLTKGRVILLLEAPRQRLSAIKRVFEGFGATNTGTI